MILLGLTGSVATILYKKIVAELKNIDPHIEVIVTKSALSFVKPELSTLVDKVWLEEDEWQWNGNLHWNKNDNVLHIDLRNRADIMVIAPVTANTMAKIANGICDNLLTSVVRALGNKQLYLAPAMNTNMWQHPLTEQHLDIFNKLGYKIIMPQSKMLACGVEGMGAMANVEDISSAIINWRFPLLNCNGIPVNPHPGAFGYLRRDKRHTGVDLYTNDGERVNAIESGKVVCIEHFTGEQIGSSWWENTECVMIEGKSGVICYGEVRPYCKVGDEVSAGEYIANVKRVIKIGRERPDIPGHSTAMLHLELYPKGYNKPSNGFESYLRDPTFYLLKSFKRPKNELIFDGYKPGT